MIPRLYLDMKDTVDRIWKNCRPLNIFISTICGNTFNTELANKTICLNFAGNFRLKIGSISRILDRQM